MNLEIQVSLNGITFTDDIHANVVADSLPEWIPVGFKGPNYFDFESEGFSFRIKNFERLERYTRIRFRRPPYTVFEGYVDKVAWKSDIEFEVTVHPYSLLLKDMTDHITHYGYTEDSGYPGASCDVQSFEDIFDYILTDLNTAVDDLGELIDGVTFTVDYGSIPTNYSAAWGTLRVLYEGEWANSDYDYSWLGRWQVVDYDEDEGDGTLYYAQATGDSDEPGFTVYEIGDPPLFYLTEVDSGLSALNLRAIYGFYYADDTGGQDLLIKLGASMEDKSFVNADIVNFQYITAHGANDFPIALVVLRQKITDTATRAHYKVALMYPMSSMECPAGDFHDITYAKMFKMLAMVTDTYYFIDNKEINWLGQEEGSDNSWSIESGGILNLQKKIGVTYKGKLDFQRKDAKLEGGVGWSERAMGWVMSKYQEERLQRMYDLRSTGSWEEREIIALVEECTGLKLLAENQTHGQIFKIAHHVDGIRVKIYCRKRE